MTARAILIAIPAAALMSCSPSSDAGPTETLSSALARVEDQCGVAPGTLTLGADNHVKFQPSVDEKYERVDCVMRELQKPEFANRIKLGFVGNEALAPEEQK
ncbi:hypothetical protein ACWKWJ_09410 [Sphingopyxis terrae subsp. ummariensis]